MSRAPIDSVSTVDLVGGGQLSDFALNFDVRGSCRMHGSVLFVCLVYVCKIVEAAFSKLY
jgi:hypothetical protein